MFEKGIEELGGIGEDAVLEITVAGVLGSKARASEVGAAKVRGLAVHDDAFEMNPRAKYTLQLAPEGGVAVEVLAEIGTGFLGVDEANCHATLEQAVKHTQERHHLGMAMPVDIHVLEVSGGNS